MEKIMEMRRNVCQPCKKFWNQNLSTLSAKRQVGRVGFDRSSPQGSNGPINTVQRSRLTKAFILACDYYLDERRRPEAMSDSEDDEDSDLSQEEGSDEDWAEFMMGGRVVRGVGISRKNNVSFFGTASQMRRDFAFRQNNRKYVHLHFLHFWLPTQYLAKSGNFVAKFRTFIFLKNTTSMFWNNKFRSERGPRGGSSGGFSTSILSGAKECNM